MTGSRCFLPLVTALLLTVPRPAAADTPRPADVSPRVLLDARRIVVLGDFVLIVDGAVHIDRGSLVGVEEVGAGLAGPEEVLAVGREGTVGVVNEPHPLFFEL